MGEEKYVNDGFGNLVLAVVRMERDEAGYWRSFWMVGCLCLVTVIWAADLFWRVVDERAVKWGRWVERRVGGGR